MFEEVVPVEVESIRTRLSRLLASLLGKLGLILIDLSVIVACEGDPSDSWPWDISLMTEPLREECEEKGSMPILNVSLNWKPDRSAGTLGYVCSSICISLSSCAKVCTEKGSEDQVSVGPVLWEEEEEEEGGGGGGREDDRLVLFPTAKAYELISAL